MNPEITITTERIDDFPLLLETMIRLGLPGILDRHLGRHGLHQGLSWGWIATIWLAHILTQSDHRNSAAGKEQPRAELGWKGDYSWRIAEALNAYTAQVSYMQAAHFSIPKLVEFYQHVRQDFPQATLLYMAQDNWPIHFHPDVLAALQPQRYQWDRHIPAHWPQEPSAKAKFLDLPIQVLSLPTYASWTNPIEKLWRLLKQEVLHLHRFEDDWVGLKQAVHEFLDQFDQESHYLLRYVGLSNPSKIYHSVVCQ
jgi:hypothetical protein